MMQFAPVPRSICDVGEAIAAGMDDGAATKEFIDSLIGAVQAAGGRRDDGSLPLPADAYAEEPPFIENPVRRVYLGGLAEHLAGMSGRKPPDWCLEARYFASTPIVGGDPARQAGIKAATPLAFARRGLFCGPVLGKLHAVLERQRVPQ
jgi:hypothetical protein